MPVVHCKREAYDVYIGRPSPFGNPFMIGRDGNRMDVIMKYRTWLWNELRSNQEFAFQVMRLHGKTLGCWCNPQPCHGDVLLRAAAFLQEHGVDSQFWPE